VRWGYTRRSNWFLTTERNADIMGYDVHITRADDWTDSEKTPITLDEWLAYIEADPEMRHDGFAEARTPEGHTLRIEADGLSVWTAYSGHDPEANTGGWFSWNDGDICVKNPDEEILRKMYAIAQVFDAHVQGDDGEEYDERGESNRTSL